MARKQQSHRCTWCGQAPVTVRGQICWACLDQLEDELFREDSVPLVGKQADERLMCNRAAHSVDPHIRVELERLTQEYWCKVNDLFAGRD